MSAPPRGLRWAPHVVVASVGYVVFAYAAVPEQLMDSLGVGFTAFGSLMSAALAAFVVAQLPAGRLVDGRSTGRVLLAGTAVHAVLAVALDVAGTFEALLALRFLWGLAGGFVLSVGATHVARLTDGAAATRAQGVYGGMLTLGGVVGFLGAPTLVGGIGAILSVPSLVGGLGLNATGALLAVPGIALLWLHRADQRTLPAQQRVRTDGATESAADGVEAGDGPDPSGAGGRVLTHPVVLAASVCYVAIIASYITLSTFVTSYYTDLGIVGPLNAFVLLMATTGRVVGGVAVWRWPLSDAALVGGATGVGALGFLALAAGPGTTLVLVLPVVAMLAVSLPFGAVYAVAADATAREGTAIATMVAAGNVAALVVPAVTGAIRDATGGYAGGFAVLAVLNVVAVAAATTLPRGKQAVTETNP